MQKSKHEHINLRTALLRTEKPRHQFYDWDSLKWLFSHKPKNLLKKNKINSKLLDAVDSLRPWEKCDDKWFLNSLTKDGIHGFRHACRVSIHALSFALTYDKKISKDELEAIMFTGILHDCRRKNDNADSLHGIRTAEWLTKHANILPVHVLSFLPAMKFAISVHNDSYQNIKKRKDYKKFKFFVDVIKVADAVDRYRFPRSDWWFSQHFIVLPVSTQKMSFAFDLAAISELLFFITKNNSKSVSLAWDFLKQKKQPYLNSRILTNLYNFK
ncbi:hypothetical protein J7J23_01880 [bacterium]|nr:hypothetical protein [bacterium]